MQVNPYSDTIVDKAKTTSSARLSRLAAGKPAVPKRPAAEKTSAAPAPRSTSTAQGQGRPLIRASVAPKPAAVQARSPNQHQHVLSVRAAAAPTPRSSATRNSSAMPIGDKPRQPQLSAAASPGVARGSTRTPLTPKVAVRGQAAAATATTPMVRRSGSSINGAQSPRSEVSSVAASSYLSHSTASRSGTRQTRAESTHTTPNSTPNLDKLSDGWETKSNRSSRGLGVSPLARTDNSGSRKSIGNSSNAGDDSKFFYASSIKPAAPTSHPPRPASVVHTKSTPTFFYASDAASKRVTSPPAYPSSSTNSLSSAQEGVATKFFHANGTPDVDLKLSARSSGSGSTVSSGSRAPRPNTSASSVAGSSTVQVHSRPASPSKNLTHPTLPPQQQQHHQQSPRPIRTGAMSPTSPVRSSAHPSPTLAGSASQVGKRRVSIEAPLRLIQGHGRAGSGHSVHSIDGVMTPKVATPTMAPPMIHAPDMTPPLLSPGLAQLSQPVTMATILQMADELEDEEDESSEDEDGEDGHSHDSDSDSRSHKRLSQNSEPLDHLVLSARRERKVQDLQITNASLEAINRTLERQLRKQSAELRRFRRLSRAGRLPMAANQGGASLSAPDASGGLTDVSEREEDGNPDNKEYDDDEDEDEEEEDEEEDEDEDSLVDSDLSNENGASGSKSTDPRAKTDSPSAKRRKRDERRLQLDLTRHQELLLDSQKMNESLKKCLNWTDLLIKEGQKALAYRVKIADVDALPGRVLAPSYYDYREDTSQAGDDTMSTVSASHFGDDTISVAESETWAKEAQDRDSGIELRPAGH